MFPSRLIRSPKLQSIRQDLTTHAKGLSDYNFRNYFVRKIDHDFDNKNLIWRVKIIFGTFFQI